MTHTRRGRRLPGRGTLWHTLVGYHCCWRTHTVPPATVHLLPHRRSTRRYSAAQHHLHPLQSHPPAPHHLPRFILRVPYAVPTCLAHTRIQVRVWFRPTRVLPQANLTHGDVQWPVAHNAFADGPFMPYDLWPTLGRGLPFIPTGTRCHRRGCAFSNLPQRYGV